MLKTLIIAIVFFFAIPAFSQELLDKEGDWKIYTVMQDSKKICYIAATPSQSGGSFKKRGEAYFLVTQKTKDQNEVSASSGFLYKKDTDVHLTLNNKTKFRLFTQDNLSWARDGKIDTSIVEAMSKASSMVVRGTSRRSTFAEDTYSLIGFSKAMEKMRKACN